MPGRPAPRGCGLSHRKHRSKPKAENHERWLVSYADFITLLFAFFVVMFATSQVNAKRMQQISEAYAAYLEGTPTERPPAPIATEQPGEPLAGQDARKILTMEEMLPVKQRLEARLAPLIEQDQIAVELFPRGLVLSLREAAFFDPGQDGFRPGAASLLTQVGEALRELPYQPIRLEGHTDNVPINTAKFPSNWELSTARAVEVLNLLRTRFDIPSERLSVAGYGEFRPVADNSSAAGRGKNRRVDIVVLSQAAAVMAPRQKLDALPSQSPAPAPVAPADSSVGGHVERPSNDQAAIPNPGESQITTSPN